MTYSDHLTQRTDVGRCQCFPEVNEKMSNVAEKVNPSCFIVFTYIYFVISIVSVIMPPSALDTLTRLNINYPMLFKLSNKRSNRHTHCGVLEFIADEEKIYIPYWVFIISNCNQHIRIVPFCFDSR